MGMNRLFVLSNTYRPSSFFGLPFDFGFPVKLPDVRNAGETLFQLRSCDFPTRQQQSGPLAYPGDSQKFQRYPVHRVPFQPIRTRRPVLDRVFPMVRGRVSGGPDKPVAHKYTRLQLQARTRWAPCAEPSLASSPRMEAHSDRANARVFARIL